MTGSTSAGPGSGALTLTGAPPDVGTIQSSNVSSTSLSATKATQVRSGDQAKATTLPPDTRGPDRLERVVPRRSAAKSSGVPVPLRSARKTTSAMAHGGGGGDGL